MFDKRCSCCGAWEPKARLCWLCKAPAVNWYQCNCGRWHK